MREGRLADNKALRVVSPVSPSRLANRECPAQLRFPPIFARHDIGPRRCAEGAEKGAEERARALQKHGRSGRAFKYLRILYLQPPKVCLIPHEDNNGEAFMSA
jgi:hypothetical protein